MFVSTTDVTACVAIACVTHYHFDKISRLASIICIFTLKFLISLSLAITCILIFRLFQADAFSLLANTYRPAPSWPTKGWTTRGGAGEL